MQVIGEVGVIDGFNQDIQTINLNHDYQNPVVFAQPLSYNNSDPAIVRIIDIQSDEFTAYLQEPSVNDGIHDFERFSYWVLEAGSWQLENGTLIEVGTVDTDLITGGSGPWENVSFDQAFATDPILFSQVQTNNDSDFLRTRQRSTTADGFQLALEEEEAVINSGHASETVGWFAISPGSGTWNGLDYQVGNTPDSVTQNFYTINFGTSFATPPNLLASLATYDGADSAGLRYQNLSNDQVQLKIDEDQSLDSETNHTTEVVNFLALGGSGLLTGLPMASVSPGELSFSSSNFSVNEDGAPVTQVTLNRTNGSFGSVSATLTLTDGTAIAAADYDNSPILVEFADGEVTQTVTIPILEDTSVEGDETINLSLTNPTGGATLGSLDQAILTVVDNDLPLGTGTGLQAEYYNNIDFTDLAVTRTDATVNFDWGRGAPDAALDPDTFSVRWTGQVQPLYSETYTFYTTTDDGVRLWVNDQLIIDGFVDQAPTEYSGEIDLVAGQKYDIRMEYYENGGGAAALLSWSSLQQDKGIIPQSQLYLPALPPGVTLTPTDGATAVTEAGAADTYTLALNTQPAEDVTVTLTSNNGQVAFDQGSFIFTPATWDVPQTVTVSAIDDAIAEGTHLDAIAHTLTSADAQYDGLSLAPVSVTVGDNDVITGTGTGLQAEYYNNIDFTDLAVTRTDATVNFDWGRGAPDAALDPDTFSVRWMGQVQPLYSETYTFYTTTDDGVRLWVNDQLIIDGFVDQAPTEYSGEIDLVAGQKYDIRLEYYENGGGAVAQLAWSNPKQAKAIIPQSQLYMPPLPPGLTMTPTDGATVVTETGAADTYTLALNAQPNEDVVVTLTSNNGQVAIDQSRLTFTADNWNLPQVVTVSAIDDAIAEGTHMDMIAYAVTSADAQYNELAVAPLSVTIVDNDSAPPAAAESIVFPADAGVINVLTYGAIPDDGQDDTAAIQTALDNHPTGNHVFYFPNGVYDISDTLTLAGSQKRNIFQGQSEAGTVLRLMDSVDASFNGAIINFGPSPAQRFRNALRNMTISIGTGHPDAVGVQFNASNQGTMQDVTIVSEDGQGAIGLDMNYTDEIGPLLITDVTVDGFDYGIWTRWPTASQTFEDITLQNQNIYGWWNTSSQRVFARGVTSNNSVTAIRNEFEAGMVLIDSVLNGTGADVPAIYNQKSLYVRNVETSGYSLGVENALSFGRGNPDVGVGYIDEFLGNGAGDNRAGDPFELFPSPNQMLGLPIQESPSIPWETNLNNWDGPHRYIIGDSGIPNDGIDDTPSIQAAIDSGATTVYLPRGTWDLSGTVTLGGNVNRFLGTEAVLDGNGTGTIQVIDGVEPTVAIERLEVQGNLSIEHSSDRTLLLNNLLGSRYIPAIANPGNVFINDSLLLASTFRNQSVWARQLNIEGNTQDDPAIDAKVLNDNAQVWILGLKTEDEGTVIKTINGGSTELYGTLHVGSGTSNEANPRFVTIDSSFSAAGVYGGGFSVLASETRSGETRVTDTFNLADAYTGYE